MCIFKYKSTFLLEITLYFLISILNTKTNANSSSIHLIIKLEYGEFNLLVNICFEKIKNCRIFLEIFSITAQFVYYIVPKINLSLIFTKYTDIILLNISCYEKKYLHFFFRKVKYTFLFASKIFSLSKFYVNLKVL